MKKKLLSACVACSTVPLVLAAASPADAATRWTFRSSEVRAAASFTVLGAADGVAGNVHVGNIEATSSGQVYGFVTDWTCPDGELPPYGGEEEPIPVDGGPGDEPLPPEPETNCVVEGSRDFWGEDVAVDISKKLTGATVSGAVSVTTWSEEGESTSTPGTVGLTFTGDGGATTSTEYSKGDGYVYKYESTQRSATVSGDVVGLSLDGADTWGLLVATKSYERFASK